MRSLSILILLFTSFSILYSQPGGGGGLYIQHLFGSDFRRIDLLSDTNIIYIRTFLLHNNNLHHETFVYQDLRSSHFRYGSRYESKDGLYLPPNHEFVHQEYNDYASDQRILIILSGDTMLIDFVGITGENGGGFVDSMDSLVFQKGHYIYYRRKPDKLDQSYEKRQHDRSILKKGFTPYTYSVLSAAGYISSKKITDLSFLIDKNFPSSYYFHLARYLLQKNAIDTVLKVIDKGLEKNNNEKNCEIIFLYTDAYKATNQIEKAIASISEGMNCKRYEWGEDSKAVNLSERAELYVLQKQYEKALADYNAMVMSSKNKLRANIKRAEFKIKYLKDYKGAVNDLKNDIEAIPEDHNRNQPNVISYYDETYFALGLAHYYNKEYTEAFTCWLKAMQCGYAQTSADYALLHFDSIIKAHPAVAENYLSRAIANYKRGPYLGWGDETKEVFQKALNDINKAEEVGMKDYRINLYRAMVLNVLKKHTEALLEINEAIKKNVSDPVNYLTRYNIRRDLGQTKWGDKTDADWVRFQELSKTWRFEK